LVVGQFVDKAGVDNPLHVASNAVAYTNSGVAVAAVLSEITVSESGPTCRAGDGQDRANRDSR
jgi:hypothetical protein